MADPVVDTQFTTGTVITSDWLNGVNDVVNGLGNSSDATRGDALVAVKQPFTGASVQTAHTKFARILDVKDFGAVGNGTTDDTAAIQAAFNAVKTTGGQLRFTAGTYRTTGYFGTNQIDAADFANNTDLYFEDGAEIFFDPNYAIPSGTWYWHVISLEGNNVSISGQGKIRTNQTLNWAGDLPAQRTNYIIGVIIGGKSYRRIAQALGQERTGARVSGLTINNAHLPLVAYAASQVRFFDNTITNDTDTAILIDDCLEDIEVAHNRCVNSGDDHFFARHYAVSPWAVAGRYIGDVRIHHNYFENTFGKFGGTGGYSDVIYSENYSRNSWFAGYNVEGDVDWVNRNHRIKFQGNIIREAGRAWDPNHPVATYRLPTVDTTVSVGILVTGVNRAENVTIVNNTISNPQSHGVTVVNAFETSVNDNQCIAGVVTKNAVNYPTTGSTFYVADANRIGFTGNESMPDSSGTVWPHIYEISGDVLTQRVKITSNPIEEAGTALFVAYSATIATHLTYIGTNLSFTQNASPSIPVGGSNLTLSCPGSLIGDFVQITASNYLGGVTMTGSVSGANNVIARFENTTGGTVNPGPTDFKMMLHRKGNLI